MSHATESQIISNDGDIVFFPERGTLQPNGRQEIELFDQFLAWRARPLGRLVAAQEVAVLASFCADLFGYHLLQMGEFSEPSDYLADCPVKGKSVLRVGERSDMVGLAAQVESFRLPIANDSIDVLIFPHTLELSADPHQLLREADRVLIPNGRLLVTGFNPLSLVGLRKLMTRDKTVAPWSGQFVPYHRLEDWLSLIGFDIERTAVRMFRPPLNRENWLVRFGAMDRYGERFWPMLAGVYVVRAVKRVSRLTPIGPRWLRLRPSRARAVEPTTRGVSTPARWNCHGAKEDR